MHKLIKTYQTPHTKETIHEEQRETCRHEKPEQTLIFALNGELEVTKGCLNFAGGQLSG